MYAFKFAWKEFNLNLQDVEAWVKANAGTNYLGNSADVELTLWYSEEPDQETKDTVQEYWDALTSESTEAENYVSESAIRTACNSLRAGLAAKEWSDMSIAERKLVLGQTPTQAELGL